MAVETPLECSSCFTYILNTTDSARYEINEISGGAGDMTPCLMGGTPVLLVKESDSLMCCLQTMHLEMLEHLKVPCGRGGLTSSLMGGTSARTMRSLRLGGRL